MRCHFIFVTAITCHETTIYQQTMTKNKAHLRVCFVLHEL